MKNENNSPFFALSKEDKTEALLSIGTGIQQLQWQADYVKSQLEALPEVPADAPKEQKEERAKRWVQFDAMEKKVEDQVEFYNFCKSQI